jgi:hypothetical protein
MTPRIRGILTGGAAAAGICGSSILRERPKPPDLDLQNPDVRANLGKAVLNGDARHSS